MKDLVDPIRPKARGRLRLILASASLLALFLAACTPSGRKSWSWRPGRSVPAEGIEEPSGIAVVGGRVLIVGDDRAGTYFSCPLPTPDAEGRLRLDPRHLQAHAIGDQMVADLEAVDLLADGRVVVLSERFGGLASADGWVAWYDRPFRELGGRGLEGVSVRPLQGGTSRVAVLWEGGYPDPDEIPPPARSLLEGKALEPVVIIHDIPAGATNLRLTEENAVQVATLRVPRPPGEEPGAQRFRAPALVWHRIDEEWGLIVLLSSGFGKRPPAGSEADCPRGEDGRPRRYCYRWLQRFTVDGEPVGEPFDLENRFPRELVTANWEGLNWFEPEKSLVLVYDERSSDRRVLPQEALVVPLPPGW